MYISIGTIITAGSLIGALGVIGGVLIAAYKFFRKPAELEDKIKKIRETHEEDIRKILYDAFEPSQAIRKLMHLVLRKGARDNTTIVSVFA